MPEHTTKHRYVVDKWKKNGKITSLRIRKKRDPTTYIFALYFNPPIPYANMGVVPEFLKEFVDKMNKGEIRFK